MNNIIFQYYPARVNTHTPLGCLTLERFLIAHKNPTTKTISIFKDIHRAEINQDNKLKAELKQNNLYYFTPCVLIHPYRRYNCIKHFTGLVVLDFDHIDNAAELKKFLFSEYDFIIAAWLSPSRHGVKCFVSIPIAADIKDFKRSWFALRDIFEIYDGWDPTTKNAVLPLFQSVDHDLLYRDNSTIFTKKTDDIKAVKYDPARYTTPHNPQNKENRIFKIARSGIEKINAPGHPQLRSIGIALGGYVASGYIDYSILLSEVNYLIASNGYLQKGVKGYQLTAKWAINEGMKKPIRL